MDGKVIREMHRQKAFGAIDIKKAVMKARFKSASAYDAFTFTKMRKQAVEYILL